MVATRRETPAPLMREEIILTAKTDALQMRARIEGELCHVLDEICDMPAPPRLAAAVRAAVLNGGSRVRPMLCLSTYRAALVADAGQEGVSRLYANDSAAANDAAVNGSAYEATRSAMAYNEGADLALAAATALELLHCASLVHDDLPCFDDAELRRGKPTIHVAFDEPTAVLAGDALIVRAFEILARAMAKEPVRGAAVFAMVAKAVGMPGGIVAGQGWEGEAEVDLTAYHRAKTGALFVAACTSGATAAGVRPCLCQSSGPDGFDQHGRRGLETWTAFGAKVGEAYQVADDLKDYLCDATELGKPAGQDARNARPNAVAQLGLSGAQARLSGILIEALELIGYDVGTRALRELLVRLSQKLLGAEAAREFKARAEREA